MENNFINAAFYRGNKTFSVEQVKLKEPGPHEVAVKIAYVGICGTDMHVYFGHMDKRVGFERIIGHEMSGYVHQVGSKVKDFQVGQPVVVRPLDHCGECPACKSRYNHICHNLKFLGLDTDGALQEIWNVPSHTLHHLPEKLRMDYAALIEPVAVACHDVRLSRLKKDEDVLVIGGGPIGVLVAINGDNTEFARQVAMHVAAANPQALSAAELDQSIVEREKNILTEQARESGKPEQVIEKMIQGRMKKFLAEVTLLGQDFVINPDLTVEAAAQEAGVEIVSYVRMAVGEGIEKVEEDFAAEVAKAAQG